jgi:hypothetical protein
LIVGEHALCYQRKKLDEAHRALSNPAHLRSISEVTETVGLFNPSGLSRMLGRRFCISAQESRLATSAEAHWPGAQGSKAA